MFSLSLVPPSLQVKEEKKNAEAKTDRHGKILDAGGGLLCCSDSRQEERKLG
jgi:hypothetical protein